MIGMMNGRLFLRQTCHRHVLLHAQAKEETMYLEISNPMDYHVALYIRLSKEDENEGPSESVTNQKSLLNEFVQQHRLSVYDTYVDDTAILGLKSELQ